ncbi:ATP-grasp domain-containing protein [Limnoraphis robusta]|uniref:ATP-grasp domain-containing protein n=1 Tax=Limnoraphis robusta CCNP1315 TaxID=3110306 RepID=A0ABU5TW25_9CYAN|nr:ATP-grasp domain-containing protein [Limnoraphis robusta]MEA5518856.1 ATP-grasp domain-containing protein [Limnoraphis robusta CCNP1315]MEA5548385.1 ATP-grasp domain-containing protein [Limnoraphis robusta CCNP1324]
MDLLEYQAKALFREMNIPVLPSQRIDRAQDLKGLRIPYPVVLKSQVRSGGRGKAGGIRFVENTIDAVAAANAIFNLPIRDEYPQVLLAEGKYNADQEFYLAVTLDPVSRRPILLGSSKGGVEVEESISEVQKVVVEQQFSPFYARHLSVKMGLQQDLILAVSNIIEKMYHLFVQKDLDLVEINPLGISPSGEVMALDGKVILNDNALGRHEDLAALIQNHHLLPQVTGQDIPSFAFPCEFDRMLQPQLKWMEAEGNIGLLCNGVDLTMATVDLIVQQKGKLAHFLDLQAEDYTELTDNWRDRLYQGLELVSQSKKVKVVLVNLLSHFVTAEKTVSEIANYLTRKVQIGDVPQFVLRLTVNPSREIQDQLTQLPVQVTESLDEAVKLAVSLAK